MLKQTIPGLCIHCPSGFFLSSLSSMSQALALGCVGTSSPGWVRADNRSPQAAGSPGRSSSDPAPRAGPDTSGASPGHRPLGAQGDARDFRAVARGAHLGGLTPPLASGRARGISTQNTIARSVRSPLLPSGGSCPGGKRAPLGTLPRLSAIVAGSWLHPPHATGHPPTPF